MTIQVNENQDGSLLITWDSTDSVESMLNTWTEQDFIQCIMDACNDTIQKQNDECKKQLEQIAERLGGKLSHWVCCDKHTEHKKFVIEYATHRKG